MPKIRQVFSPSADKIESLQAVFPVWSIFRWH